MDRATYNWVALEPLASRRSALWKSPHPLAVRRSRSRRSQRMADYIYTMEIRLTPDQQRGVTLVQDVARAAGMNIYLTGGAVRDIISGFSIRDLDFTVQGNPLSCKKNWSAPEPV